MKNTLFYLVIFFLNMAGLVLPITAQAGEIRFVNGTLRSTDVSGCISTDVFVFIRSGGFQASSEKAFISVLRINDCKEVQLMTASGSATLKDQDLQLDPNLDSATLVTTVGLTDRVSRRNFNVGVNLAWTGTGDLIRTRNNFHFESPGKILKEKKHFDGTYREAQVSGSISEGFTDFTPEPSIEGEMALAKQTQQ